MLTDQELAAIQARCEAATAGPWLVDHDPRPDMSWNNHIILENGNAVCFMAHDGRASNAYGRGNAHFIAHARTDIPALLATIAELRVERDALKKHYDEAGPEHNLLALLDEYDDRRRAMESERDEALKEGLRLTLVVDKLRASLAAAERGLG